MTKIYQDDVGTIFEVEVGEDLSTANATDLKVLKPDGTTIETWIGAVNGAINTQIDYTIDAGDLDQVGTYFLQSYVEFAAWTGRGETVEFIVYRAFK